MLALFMVVSLGSAQSQILISLLLGDKLNSPGLEFGLEGGISYSDVMNLETSKNLYSFNLGFYFDILMQNNWYLYTGVHVKSHMGVDKLTTQDLDFLQIDQYLEEGSYRQIINYFIVPIFAKYRLNKHFYVEAGPQLALMHKPYVEFNSHTDGKDARIRQYNADAIHRIDAGLAGGFGYKVYEGWGMTFGVKYYYGLVDVYKNLPGSNNKGMFFKVNIPIGTGTKKQDTSL